MANNTLAVNNLDFAGLRANFVQFMQNQSKFQDYNFEGSNISTIIDLLTYNTYINSFYTNMVMNEMFMDTATLRDSVVSHAKDINYIPRSARSAEAYVDITIFPTDSPTTITIPGGTVFQSTDGNGGSYTFLTSNDNHIVPLNNTYTITNVLLVEGVNVTETFTVNTAVSDQRFILSNPNIDTTSLQVYLTNSSGLNQQWEYHTNLLGVTTTTPAYFLQATANNYEIVFGDGVSGLSPVNGSTISANYRVCNMDAPNGVTQFKCSSAIAGYTNYFVSTSNDSNTNIIAAAGGMQPESISSIRFNAPKSYQTLDRAVTSDDYRTILFAQFPEIRDVYVYGGDEASPPQYGTVYISVDISNEIGLSQVEQNKIQSFLINKVPIGITPEVISGDYTYVSITTNVSYNQNISSAGESDIHTLVLNAINTYATNNLNKFKTRFRYSQLLSAIDNADSSITDQQTTTQLMKVLTPTLNTTFSQALSYQNEFVPGTISSSIFTYNNLNCSIIDDSKGSLKVVSTISGVQTVVGTAGTVDYTNGIINLVNFNVSAYPSPHMKIYATTVVDDCSTVRNMILSTEASDIVVTVTGIRN